LEVIEPDLTRLIAQGDEQAFERVFLQWFDGLYAYAFSVIKEQVGAEEVVQTVFCRIWEKRASLKVHTSLKAYLYGSVYHECISWLRREEKRRRHRAQVMKRGEGTVDPEDRAAMGELKATLQQALKELPQQCRAIFLLSRYGELRYQEIADQLDLSIKTVETQISKALKLLRQKLADHL